MKSFHRLFVFCACVSFAPVFAGEAATAYAPAISVTPLLKTQVDGAGRPIAYPVTGAAEITAVLVEIPPGAQTNWHHHPVPCFAYLLEGELQVELAGGEKKTLKAGQAFAEVVDLLHNGMNRGPGPVRLVMFVAGVAGQPYAVRAPGAPGPARAGP